VPRDAKTHKQLQICFAGRQDTFERTYLHGKRTKWKFFMVSIIFRPKFGMKS